MSAICGGHRSPLAPSGKNDHVRSAEEWHLSPKQSLLLQAENTVVNSPLAANNKIELVFGTSLHDLKEVSMPPIGDLMMRNDGSCGFERDVSVVFTTESEENKRSNCNSQKGLNPSRTRVAGVFPRRPCGLSHSSV